jgi:hypothetical protein
VSFPKIISGRYSFDDLVSTRVTVARRGDGTLAHGVMVYFKARSPKTKAAQSFARPFIFVMRVLD